MQKVFNKPVELLFYQSKVKCYLLAYKWQPFTWSLTIPIACISEHFSVGFLRKAWYDAIQKATEAYNKLTATQKKLVDAKLVQQLQDASARYKELLEQTTDANGEKVPTDQLLVPDEVQTEDTQPFDWSIVWISLGILAAAGVITFVIRWFIAMRRAKQKKET